MPKSLTPQSTLDTLKRDAKRWLRDLRAGTPEARARFARVITQPPAEPTLRDVQLAIAREYGFAGWSEIKRELSRRTDRTDQRLVDRFLDHACPDHHVRGRRDHLRASTTAIRLLTQHPALTEASFQTALVTGNVTAVRRALIADPSLAIRPTPANPARSGGGNSGDLEGDLGSKGWEPLLYLAFTRLPLPAVAEHAVELATMLLDAGANPNAFFMAGGSRYTPLVGVIGEGEEERPAHPSRDALVDLLLSRGADPFDMQVVYNIGVGGDVLWFLEQSHSHSMGRGLRAAWDDPDWAMLGMGGYGNGARWHLDTAIRHNSLPLVRWCLEHGANPNAAPARAQQRPQSSLHESALRGGCTEIAALLLQHGATVQPVTLTPTEQFTAAALRLDRNAMRILAAAYPVVLQSTATLFTAIERQRIDVVTALLDLGVSIEVTNAANERPLHMAAYHDALEIARLLLDRGADVDAVENNHGNTALGAANWRQNRAMLELLAPVSHDIWNIASNGLIDRLRELLHERPERARVTWQGNTPLMWLPLADEELALAVVREMLAHGTDPTLRNSDGMSAGDRAEAQGMTRVAALLREAEAKRTATPSVPHFEAMAERLLEAYQTGTAAAMDRHWRDTWHRRSWDGMRRYVRADLGLPDDEALNLTLEQAREWVARDQQFRSWQALVDYFSSVPANARNIAAAPVVITAARSQRDDGRFTTRQWDEAIERIQGAGEVSLAANGQMTDAVLERIARLPNITTLDLSNSTRVSDSGIALLAYMPQLRSLNLAMTAVTDHGLAALTQLTALESLKLAATPISDAGVAMLGHCAALRQLDLMGTRTGDGALRALALLPRLTRLLSGGLVTDAGLPLLQQYPAFNTWHGGSSAVDIFDDGEDPNHLTLRGSFTDRGLATLAALEGLYSLDIGDAALAISGAGMAPLAALPHLDALSCEAHDDAMPHLAALPVLRRLSCQDTDASDTGWAALAASPTIERIWGRRCHGLGSRGFRALATMPSLRILSVSCLNVPDDALALLPQFPVLRGLMPIDVPDEGYRHIGRCERLEKLTLMYCRDTTDRATEQITTLPRLAKYFASYTRVTDRTPQLLAEIQSLEEVEFDSCAALTDIGIAELGRLPRLRSIRVSGIPGVTAAVRAAFPAGLEVRVAE